MKREFLQLAHKYNPQKHNVIGWYASTKLDGVRAYWDSGFTRGIPCSSIPFSNTAKDGRRVHFPVSTGLWTRYGHTIHAPDAWLDRLPKIPLDGELFCINGFQNLISIAKRFVPNEKDWENVVFNVFDSPSPHEIFKGGKIETTNFKKDMTNVFNWVCRKIDWQDYQTKTFEEKLKLFDNVEWNQTVLPLPQTKILTLNQAQGFLNLVLDRGGEGIMLRNPKSVWVPERSHTLLKWKGINDAEGIVIGYTFGKETDLGSKHLGKMGSLRVSWKGKEFDLSGFTDTERELTDYNYGCEHPGELVPSSISNPMFPRGSKITFRYRSLTDEGIPKEARHWRQYSEI